MIKIGFDAKRAFSNGSGLGNYSRFTINALCEKYPENKYHLYAPTLNNNTLYNPPDITTVTLPANTWPGFLHGYWRSIFLTSLLKKEGIELFHGLSNELPLGIEKSGVHSVVTIHDLIFLRIPELYNSIDRRIYLNKTQNAVKKADRIVAISHQTKKDLVELVNADESKIRIVYQGCHPWFYNKVDEKQLSEARTKYNLPEQYLLYVGTVEERKNLMGILKALHQGNIDIPLVVLGKKTAYYKKVIAFVSQNNLKNIIFCSFAKNSELPAFYQMATAFLYPSKYEGFGIPVIEALNSGVPVITSRGTCLEETAGDGALLVDPGNIEEISDAIIKIISEQELRNDLIEKGRNHVLKFREEYTIPQLMKVYNECLA